MVDSNTGSVRRIERSGHGGGLWGFSLTGATLEMLRHGGLETLVYRTPERERIVREANAFYRKQPDPVIKTLTFKPDRLASGVTGKCCDAVLCLPSGSTQPRPLPLVVNIYLERDRPRESIDSFMDLGTVPEEDPRFLTSNGYAYLVPAMPWKRGRNAGDAIDAVAAYVLPAIAEAVRSGWVDRDRIAFIGESFGGLNVLQLLTRTDIAKAAISDVGPFNLMAEWGTFNPSETLAASAFSIAPQASLTEGGQFGMRGAPWESAQQYLYNSPDQHIASVRTPVLLIKGDQDYISQNASEYAFSALRRIGVPTRLVLFNGEGHAVNFAANLAREAREVLDWLKTYLAQTDPATATHFGQTRSRNEQ